MGLNELAVKVGVLEERMSALEEHIMSELEERKEGQKEIRADVMEIKKKIWLATGFLMAVQIVLQVILKVALK